MPTHQLLNTLLANKINTKSLGLLIFPRSALALATSGFRACWQMGAIGSDNQNWPPGLIAVQLFNRYFNFFSAWQHGFNFCRFANTRADFVDRVIGDWHSGQFEKNSRRFLIGQLRQQAGCCPLEIVLLFLWRKSYRLVERKISILAGGAIKVGSFYTDFAVTSFDIPRFIALLAKNVAATGTWIVRSLDLISTAALQYFLKQSSRYQLPVFKQVRADLFQVFAVSLCL